MAYILTSGPVLYWHVRTNSRFDFRFDPHVNMKFSVYVDVMGYVIRKSEIRHPYMVVRVRKFLESNTIPILIG